MMKNGQLNLVFAAAFAAILTGCPGPVMPPSGDGGMPDNDAFVSPPVDGGMDIDAYVDPGTDAGTDAASLPGACTPEQIAAGTPGCSSCYCEMDALMVASCTEAPDQCRTGVGLRNTCDMTGNNRCGFALPLDGSGNMTVYTGGLSMNCQLAFTHTIWATASDGAEWNVELMQLNGQTVMRWSSFWGPQWTCEQQDGHDICYSNAANADIQDHAVLTPAADCLTAEFRIWHAGSPGSSTTLSFVTWQ